MGSPLFVANVGTFAVTAINTGTNTLTMTPSKLIGTAPYSIPVNALVSSSGFPGPTGLTGAVGPSGTNGNTIWNGTTAPSNSLGQNGDFYLNTATNILFGPKAGGVWPGTGVSVVGPIGLTGPSGTAGTNGNTIWNGTTAPSSGLGVNGDFYLNTATDVLYGPKAGGTWPGTGTSLIGPAGTNGNTMWNGTTVPSNTVGQNGDFYINTATEILYGPKAGGTWPATGVTLVGPQGASGNTIWNGTSSAPAAGLGQNGDFYINTTGNVLWGPKAAGAWPGSGVSLVGPQGTPGATGSQGIPGPTSVSTDANNYAVLGSDHLLYVPIPSGSTADFGDLVAPSSPTVYDDEFTAGTLNSKWTVSNTGPAITCLLQPPTYLTQTLTYQGTGTTNYGSSAKQNLTAPVLSTSFMFQFKVRWSLFPYITGAATTSTYIEFEIGLTKTTATTKGFWLYGQAQCYEGTAGTQQIMSPLQIQFVRGVNAGTGLLALTNIAGGLDLRVQMGVNASGNLVCNLSMDGYNWVTVYSENFASGPTFTGLVPNLLTLGFDNGGGGTNAGYGSGYVAWDYVRCLHL